MKETRASKYGRFLSEVIIYIINTTPQDKRTEYKSKFLEELQNFSFQRRRKGEPKHTGCRWELYDIENFNITYPTTLAKTIKEGLQLMYQKDTQKTVMQALMKNLEK